MVGLLGVLKGTNLETRLKDEERLLPTSDTAGDNTSVDGTLNFVTQLDPEFLREEFCRITSWLYEPTRFYQRCLRLFERLGSRERADRKIGLQEVLVGVRFFTHLILSEKGWQLTLFLAQVLRRHPRMMVEAVRLAIMGHHFEAVAKENQRKLVEMRKRKEKRVA